MNERKPMWIVQVKGHWRGRDGGWRPAMGTSEKSAFYDSQLAGAVMGAFQKEAQNLKLDAAFRLFQVEELPEVVP